MSVKQPSDAASRQCPFCHAIHAEDAPQSCPATADTLASPGDTGPLARAEEGLSDELIGTIVGERYEILERLGRGGMGVVYKARHTVLESFLAIKILLRTQDAEAERRFLQEAKLASKVYHPNTVHVSDFGVLADGRQYLVMEFLRGPTLAKVLEHSYLEPRRAVEIAIQIARGLSAIHGAGIVHRDLKPENIFLLDPIGQTGQTGQTGKPGLEGQQDFVKIVDFGIALGQVAQSGGTAVSALPLPAEGGDRFTLPGTLLGTPRYISPEQAQGSGTDARADQYALGCILFEMLTGKAPFEAPTLSELLALHISTPPPSLQERAPERNIPWGLSSLCMRLLQKFPDERFAAMRDVEEGLRSELESLRPRRAWKVLAPRRNLWVLLGALLLLGLSGHTLVKMRTRRTASVEAPLAPDELLPLRRAATSLLDEQLSTGRVKLDRETVWLLASTQEESSRALLEKMLKSQDPRTQNLGVLGLFRLGSRSALPALRELAAAQPSRHVRTNLTKALSRLGDPEARQSMEALLTSPDAEQVLTAAAGLDQRCHKAAMAARLKKVSEVPAQEAPSQWLLNSWRMLAACGDEDAHHELRRVAAEDTGGMGVRAAEQLIILGDAEGERYVRRLTNHPGRGVALLLFLAIQGLTVDSEVFRSMLRDREASQELRGSSAVGLGYCGRPADLRLLFTELSAASNPELRQLIAAAILRLSARSPSRGPASSDFLE